MLLWTAAWVACLLPVSCEDDQRPLLADFESPVGEPWSLRETADRLRLAHARKQYLALRPYIDPPYRDAMIDVLMAVDELTAANAAALKAVARVSPDTPTTAFDISGFILDNLELFSREVEVVGVREEGDAGVVEIEIARTPPSVEVHFRRHNGHWVYAPGPQTARIVPVFRELTTTLNSVAKAIAFSDHLTPEQVQYEFRLRVQPKLQKLRDSAATP